MFTTSFLAKWHVQISNKNEKMVKTTSPEKKKRYCSIYVRYVEHGPGCRVHQFCIVKMRCWPWVGSGKPCSYMSRQSSRRSSCCEPPFLHGESSSSERRILVVAKFVHCSKILHFKLPRFGLNLHDGMSHLRDVNFGHTLSLGDVNFFPWTIISCRMLLASKSFDSFWLGFTAVALLVIHVFGSFPLTPCCFLMETVCKKTSLVSK